MTAYEEAKAQAPKPDAPFTDNPSGMYCQACRQTGLWHCSDPEHCGCMEPMRPLPASPTEKTE